MAYNQVKISTWDRIFFKKAAIDPEFYLLNKKKNPFLELDIDISQFDISVQEKLALWVNPQWSQDQYIFNYDKPGFVEPHVGWALTLDKKLIYPSLGFASAQHVHKPSFFETYFTKPSIKNLGKIISLRDTGEENYFHFFNDVFAKIFFLQENNVDITCYTIVISNKLYAKLYFQYYLTHSFFCNLKWYVHKSDEWIKFETAIFCKPYTHTKKYLDQSIGLVRSSTYHDTNRKIFLTRNRNSLRFIENMDTVENVLVKYNFEVIDAEQLDFKQQVELFSQCRYLIAIHGAGITNIIFRSGMPLALLEIVHPSPYIPFHYIMMCKLYNYQYDAMLGAKGKTNGQGGFCVDPYELELKIKNMIGIQDL